MVGRPGWSPLQQLGGPGAEGGQLVLRTPPTRTPGICRLCPHLAARLRFLRAAGVRFSFCSAPRGKKANTVAAAAPPGALQTFVTLALLRGPGPPLPPLCAARSAAPVPAFPPRPAGLHSCSRALSVHIRQMGVHWGGEPSLPRRLGFLELRKVFPSLSHSLLPTSHLFSRVNHFFNLFDRHLLRTYCVPGHVVGTRLI